MQQEIDNLIQNNPNQFKEIDNVIFNFPCDLTNLTQSLNLVFGLQCFIITKIEFSKKTGRYSNCEIIAVDVNTCKIMVRITTYNIKRDYKLFSHLLCEKDVDAHNFQDLLNDFRMKAEEFIIG